MRTLRHCDVVAHEMETEPVNKFISWVTGTEKIILNIRNLEKSVSIATLTNYSGNSSSIEIPSFYCNISGVAEIPAVDGRCGITHQSTLTFFINLLRNVELSTLTKRQLCSHFK